MGGPRPNPKPTTLTRRTLLAVAPVVAVAGSAALRPDDLQLPRAISPYLGPNCSPLLPMPNSDDARRYSVARLQGVSGRGVRIGDPLSSHILRPVVAPDGTPLGSVSSPDDGTSEPSNLGRSPALILTTAGIFEG